MRSANNFIFILLGYSLLSCGGEGENPIKEESYYLQDIHKDWLAPDTVGQVFIMKDMNGISASFRMTGKHENMGKSWSTVMGINTRTSYTEEIFQSYKSSFGLTLALSMRAHSPPHGDNISISLDQVGFKYDFDFKIVHSLDTPFGYKSLLMTDKGYEVHDDGEIHSTLDILDSLTTAYATYFEVLHFTFNDFNTYWTDFTVREIYLAREVGLVRYVLESGLSSERVP